MKKMIMRISMVFALALLLSVTAFAEETEGIQAGTAQAVGDHASDITISNVAADRLDVTYTNAEDGRQYLIVATTDKVTGAADLKAEEIIYIDQLAAAGTSRDFTVYPKSLSDGTYYVWMSSDASNGITSLEKVAEFEAKGPKYEKGDVTMDGKVNSFDARAVLQHSLNIAGKTLSGDALKLAEVTGDGKVNSFDARDILRYSLNIITEFK